MAEQYALNNKIEFIKFKISMEDHKEKFFDENLANFDYQAETLGTVLTILQDSEAFYNNLSVEDPRAEMMKKFPNSRNINYEAVQHDIHSK